MQRFSAALVAALSGFAVMSVELAAVRLFAPYFGDSAYVWTNVIGVLLVALAIGAWLGGRAADPDLAAARLAKLLIVAGLLAAVVPFVARPLGGWLLPSELPLDAAMPALVRGSLAATLLAFAPPVLLAGTATPMLVAALVGRDREQSVGRAAGLVAAWSTLGSLAGTFATTHLLVPGLGSRATVWLCAALWIVGGAVCGGRRLASAAALAPLAFLFLPLGAMRPASGDAELLAERESAYQFLQVVRMPGDGEDAPAVTELKINEGLDSFHSVKIEGTPWTGGRYYDFHAAVPFLVGDGERPRPLRVLSLGAAAGTFERIYSAVHPGSRIDSVELDPEVVALGREHFDAFENEGRVFAGLDARVFVELADERWHVVLVDAYERQIYVPAHVASREFFTTVSDRLEPGGVVSVNVGGRSFDDPVVEVIGRTIAEVFGEAWAFRVPDSRNFALIGRRGRGLEPAALERANAGDPGLRAVLDAMSSASAWRRFQPDGEVLVDDRPFLDELQTRSLARGAAGEARALAFDGELAIETVEQRVYSLMLAGEWNDVLDRAVEARRPTAWLRLSLGDARWSLRDLRGARAEWLAATELEGSGELREPLERRLADANAQISAFDRATEVAARNAWIAAMVGLVLAAVALLLARRYRDA